MQRQRGVLSCRAWGRSAPATFPQRVIVIADLGMSYNSSTTMQHVQARPPCRCTASLPRSVPELACVWKMKTMMSRGYDPQMFHYHAACARHVHTSL